MEPTRRWAVESAFRNLRMTPDRQDRGRKADAARTLRFMCNLRLLTRGYRVTNRRRQPRCYAFSTDAVTSPQGIPQSDEPSYC